MSAHSTDTFTLQALLPHLSGQLRYDIELNKSDRE